MRLQAATGNKWADALRYAVSLIKEAPVLVQQKDCDTVHVCVCADPWNWRRQQHFDRGSCRSCQCAAELCSARCVGGKPNAEAG